MDVAHTELLGQEFTVNAKSLRPFRWWTGPAVPGIYVRSSNGNIILIKKLDDFRIGERTRSEGESPTSTASRFYFPVVREHEDRPI